MGFNHIHEQFKFILMHHYRLLICAIFAIFPGLVQAISDKPAIVELQTNLGTVTIQLDYEKAPISSANFASYATNKFYNKTLFHRVIKDFVIQGGGFDLATGRAKTTSVPINSEANNGLSNTVGTIAMARTDNPNSATSQFFINLANNTFLDHTATTDGYAVFGKVINGLEIVKLIGNLSTKDFSDAGRGVGLYSNLPFTENHGLVFVESVYVSDLVSSNQTATRVVVYGQGKVKSRGMKCSALDSDSSTCQTVNPKSNTKKITLIAASAKNYTFNGWRGDCSGYRTTIYLDLRTNHNCTATFAKITP